MEYLKKRKRPIKTFIINIGYKNGRIEYRSFKVIQKERLVEDLKSMDFGQIDNIQICTFQLNSESVDFNTLDWDHILTVLTDYQWDRFRNLSVRALPIGNYHHKRLIRGELDMCAQIMLKLA